MKIHFKKRPFTALLFASLCTLLCTSCILNPKNYRKELNTSSADDSQNDRQKSMRKERRPSSADMPFFDWPVDEARLTRGYLPKKRRPHLGVDLAAPRGTKVYAAHDGTVIYTGRGFKGFGKMVMVQGPGNSQDAWASLYAHLSAITVREGERVRQGDFLGEIGSTGRSTGNHLHFEIRKKNGPVDPLQFLPHITASN